jgi:predicted aspartyl protease
MPRIEGIDVGAGRYRPMVEITIELPNGNEGRGFAIVDSGADETIIPGDIIQALGVKFSDLPAAGSGTGAGGAFKQGLCKGVIRFRGQEVCTEFTVAEPGKLGAALLGRSDFFSKFVVRFQWHRNPPFMDIDPVVKKK